MAQNRTSNAVKLSAWVDPNTVNIIRNLAKAQNQTQRSVIEHAVETYEEHWQDSNRAKDMLRKTRRYMIGAKTIFIVGVLSVVAVWAISLESIL